MSRPVSKTDDPAWRRERARTAARARTTPDAHIQALVDAAPPLTAEQRARLAVLLGSAGGDTRLMLAAEARRKAREAAQMCEAVEAELRQAGGGTDAA